MPPSSSCYHRHTVTWSTSYCHYHTVTIRWSPSHVTITLSPWHDHHDMSLSTSHCHHYTHCHTVTVTWSIITWSPSHCDHHLVKCHIYYISLAMAHIKHLLDACHHSGDMERGDFPRTWLMWHNMVTIRTQWGLRSWDEGQHASIVSPWPGWCN